MNPPLVLVTWEDASQVDDTVWVDTATARKAEAIVFRQVGWLLEQTKQHIVLSACMGTEIMSARDRIPMGMVRSITVFDPAAGVPYKAPRRKRAS